MELLKFLFIYALLTISILGYGLVFSTKLTKYNNFQNNDISIGYVGLFGIFFSIILSYLSNFLLPHNNFHNLSFILIGIIFFFIFLKRTNKKFISSYFVF